MRQRQFVITGTSVAISLHMLTGWLAADTIWAEEQALSAGGAARTKLEKEFYSPSDEYRPWVMAFINNGNLTKEGITADLEAMARVGIGGILSFEFGDGFPAGPTAFMSSEWRELYRHMIRESQRLGLRFSLNNCPGYNCAGGPWIPPELSMQKLVWTKTRLSGGQRFEGVVQQPKGYKDFYRDIALFAYPTPSAEGRVPGFSSKSLAKRLELPPPQVTFPRLDTDAVIGLKELIDLTGHLSPDGRLKWDAPEGDWTLLRLGHTSTGVMCHPAPKGGEGLECDKMSKEAIKVQFDGMLGKVIEDVGELAGTTLTGTHVDSWEVGTQNWTPELRSEFKKRRGYDPQPWLPVLADAVVDSLESSERFLWDFRMTVSELLRDNFFGGLQELANRHGMKLSAETYHWGPFNDLSVAGRVDEPMGTFWAFSPYLGAIGSCWDMASAGHVYGKTVVSAEACTSGWQDDRWLGYPGNVKEVIDCAFGAGINKLIFHRYVMQPWVKPERYPGVTYLKWGLHYERTQTWWEQSRPFNEYLARCQHMLRQGLCVSDICYLMPENSPQCMTWLNKLRERPGYGFDLCPAEVVLTRMSVKDGRLMLPDGTNYRLLVLPNAQAMTPQLVEKIRDLIKAGAAVAGNPPRKSPSLENYPQCDQRVRKLALEIWGAEPVPEKAEERAFGKGKVLCGHELTPYAEADLGVLGAFEWAKWIWVPKDEANTPVSVGKYYFRNTVDLDGEIESARLVLSAGRPGATVRNLKSVKLMSECWINGVRLMRGYRDGLPVPYNAAPALKTGKNLIAFELELEQDSPGAGLAAALTVRLKDGRLKTLVTDGAWEASASAREGWKTEVGPLPGWSRAMELAPTEPDTQGRLHGFEESVPYWTMFVKDMPVAGALLGQMGVLPDFVCESTNGLAPRYIHRVLGDTDIYFVANQEPVMRELVCRFRVQDKLPEFWWPESGRIEPVTIYEQSGGHTRIPLRLECHESVFVVFRKISQTSDVRNLSKRGQNWLEFKPVQDLTGPWEVLFDPKWGGPEKSVRFETLTDWASNTVEGVKYYSGTAVYRKTFDCQRPTASPRVFLDLGRVEVMAEVTLNGKNLGTLWKRPYRVEVTDAIKPGTNAIEVKVVNVWVNRMIGDEQLPEDSERNDGGLLRAWPQWLLDGLPSPTGRYTFCGLRAWKKGEPLVPSGLLGPVRLLGAE